MKVFNVIDLVRAKRRAIGAAMSGLAALAARAFGIAGLGWLDDIRGRGLRGVRRVLGKPGHLFGQLGNLGLEVGHLGFQGRILGLQGEILGFQVSDPSLIELFLGQFHRPIPAQFGTILLYRTNLRLEAKGMFSFDMRGGKLGR